MSVIGRIATVWIVVVAVIRVAITASVVIVPIIAASETKETPVAIEATARPGEVLTGNAVTDAAHMDATPHMTTTKSAGNMSTAEPTADMCTSESAAAKSATNMPTAESAADVATSESAPSMTAAAPTTMAGGKGVRSHRNTERYGGDEDHGVSCHGLLPDVLNVGHGISSAAPG
jgi:hypothetical protein